MAFAFTIEADDALFASLSGASAAEHHQSLPRQVYFDYTGPSIVIQPDSAAYARTAAAITVTATITDPAGVPSAGVFLNGNVPPVTRSGSVFTFHLDPLGAPAGKEGPYAFQISASDNLSNAASAGASRIVDDAPPTASVRVYKGTSDPGIPGVTYPALVARTGWDGTQFIYNDTVRVKGTLTDASGLASAAVHIDGIALDGTVTAGTARPLGCTRTCRRLSAASRCTRTAISS